MAEDGSARAAGRGNEGADVVVVGAGVAGISAALYLQRDGHRVTVLDPEPPGSMTSFGNAGVIAAYGSVPTATPDMLVRIPKLLADPLGPLRIRWRHLPRMTPWLLSLLANSAPERIRVNAAAKATLLGAAWEAWRVLIEDAGIGELIGHGGMLRVYETDAAFERAKNAEFRIIRESGLDMEILGADEIRQLEPALAPVFRHGLYSSDSHNIRDPGRVVARLAERFSALGGTVLEERATGLARRSGGGWRITVEGGGERVAPRVVLAAGAWSARLARTAGLRILLDTERGYHAMLPAPERGLRRSVHFAEATFMLSPMVGGYRLTTGVELAGIEAPPDYRRLRRAVRQVERMLPGIRGEPQSLWMGRRPSTPDTVPVLGQAPGAEGLYFATGGAHIGMTLGPVMGRITADLIAGRDPGVDLAPYAPDRWRGFAGLRRAPETGGQEAGGRSAGGQGNGAGGTA